MGLSQMSNFDSFFGSDNFGGFNNEQTIIVQEQEIVCDTQEIEIVQQRISVLMEFMKQ